MAEVSRFGKPNMTNLPPDLGMAIFRQIMTSPAPDREKMRRESQRLVRENLKVRKREITQRDSAL